MLYSRRSVLAGLVAIGTAALTPPRHAFARIDDRPFFFFTDDEARFLALICDTLIPEDEFPSASQAGVVDYIDLQMAGPWPGRAAVHAAALCRGHRVARIPTAAGARPVDPPRAGRSRGPG